MARPPSQSPPPPPWTERLSSWIKLGLLAAVPLYLLGDLAAGYVNQQNRREVREQLCFRFEDEAAEAARQRRLPVTILGKFDHFIRCGSIQEISLLGGKISNERIIAREKKETEEQQLTAALLEQAREEITRLAQDADAPVGAGSGITALTQDLAAARQELVQTVNTREARITRLESLAPQPEPAGQWLLVAGADQSDEAAADQVRQMRALIAANLSGALRARTGPVELRLVRSWRRTVVVFDTREAARDVLAALKDVLPYGGYVRPQAEWCPDLAPAEPIGGIQTRRCES